MFLKERENKFGFPQPAKGNAQKNTKRFSWEESQCPHNLIYSCMTSFGESSESHKKHVQVTVVLVYCYFFLSILFKNFCLWMQSAAASALSQNKILPLSIKNKNTK